MPLSAGPYYFTVFGSLNTMIPLATSPVERYVAPDAVSSWTALGIHGYVLKCNDHLTQINSYIDGAYKVGVTLNGSPDPDVQQFHEETMANYVRWGSHECKSYVEYLAASHDSIMAGCAHLKIPLPKHGSTAGMKPVYTLGMAIPQGSWLAT